MSTDKDVADFRSRVCDAAADLLTELGSEGFNMRGLARCLGVSAMTTYRYFKDKDEILAAVLSRGFARLAGRLEAASEGSASPEDRFEAMACAYLEFAREEPAYYRSMFDLARERQGEFPELRQEEARVRELFAGVRDTGTTKDFRDGNADFIGAILWPTLHGIASLKLTGRASDPECRLLAAEAVRALVRYSSRADHRGGTQLLRRQGHHVEPGMRQAMDALP